MTAEEVDLSYMKSNENSDIAICMKNGNFYWLTEEEKEIKKKMEEEEKEDDEEKKSEENKSSREKEEEKLEGPIKKRNDVNVNLDENPLLLGSQVVNALEVVENDKLPYKLILKDINIEIKKGSFIAILGE